MLDLLALYLFKLKHLLSHYINQLGNFFDKIKFSYKYFDYKKSIYKPDIIKIIVYYQIVKKYHIVKIKYIIIKNILYNIEIFLSTISLIIG